MLATLPLSLLVGLRPGPSDSLGLLSEGGRRPPWGHAEGCTARTQESSSGPASVPYFPKSPYNNPKVPGFLDMQITNELERTPAYDYL